MGNHNLVFHSDESVEPNRNLDLRISHFPLRSKEQAMSKIIVGWLNVLHKYLNNNLYGIHWKLFFEKIRQTSSISDEDLELFSKNYSFKSFRDDIEIKRQPMNLDFFEDIEIKYDYEYNCMANV